jgi:hypothetical protein
MTVFGWIFMLGSTLSVAALTVWCYVRVLSAPAAPPEPVQKFHSA